MDVRFDDLAGRADVGFVELVVAGDAEQREADADLVFEVSRRGAPCRVGEQPTTHSITQSVAWYRVMWRGRDVAPSVHARF